MTKDELLGAFSEAHDALLIAADAAVTRGDPRDDGWGLREVLAHIAAWEDEAARRIPLLRAGVEAVEYDFDAFNAVAVAAMGQRSAAEVRARLDEAHARLVTLLNGLDDSAFAPHGAAGQWVGALTRHDQEHARALSGGAAPRE